MLPPIFQRPLSDLPRVGKKLASLLAKIDLHTQGDLLFHFPLRYEDFRTSSDLDNVPLDTPVTVRGTITMIGNKQSFRRRLNITEALLDDGNGSLRVVWYNQPYLVKNIHVGDQVALSGKVVRDTYGVRMTSPQYERIATQSASVHTGRIVPMYPLTEGITQKQMRFFIQQVLPLISFLPEWLPDSVRQKNQLSPYAQALRQVHFPASFEEQTQARRRLQFDELFITQLGVLQHRAWLQTEPAPALLFQQQPIKNFVATLPFPLTLDQKKSAWEILQDMEKTVPMNRLLQGEVGSGKTVIAVIAAYQAFLSGQQTVLMSPTEILAQQTFQVFRKFFPPQVRVALFTGSVKNTLTDADVVIGTHALIENILPFRKLGLAIIDEQHRFGVAQRKRLRSTGDGSLVPHLLSMTATPIPRSLLLTLYGDLHVSQIRTKPKRGSKVSTQVIGKQGREKLYTFVRSQMEAGRQVFVICPIIEESDVLGVSSAIQVYEEISRNIFSDFRVGLLHGRLRPAEKETVFNDFRTQKIHILVSTSVVEVGIDIPNATVILIYGAERFGLAQLHQLRGRVGRGEHDSHCFLLPETVSEHHKRLKIIESVYDGFRLAEEDLKIRGGGNIYGQQQSGFTAFKIADPYDLPLLETARSAAQDIMALDPKLENFPELKKRAEAWGDAFHAE